MTELAMTDSGGAGGAGLASRYFATGSDAFWVWSPDLDTIVTRQGTTIAFYQEIVAVLRALAPVGFPAFEAVAVFLAVCRNEASVLEEWRMWAGQFSHDWDSHHLHQALEHFHSTTHQLRKSVDDKAALAAIVFENISRVIPRDDAGRIVSHLEARRMNAPGQRTAPSGVQMAMVLEELIRGLNAVDAEQLATRLRTGIGAEMTAMEPPVLHPSKRARQLLQELQEENDELSGLASVTLDLMAAVHIPRAIDEPESLPLGGYSDISNRGAPDRLLLTELAQDDDVLAARVNMNEALYLRREAPPLTPQLERTILVDTGIRLWGVPRVFATALALALCATASERQPLRVFRTTASDRDDVAFEDADLLTREGLTQHLSELSTRAHPGMALRSLAEKNNARDGDDVIVVTHPDAFADEDFLRFLRQLTLGQCYVALVDAKGTYELWLLSRRGRKRLQRAECRLDGLLKPSSQAFQSVLNPDIDPDLPLALRMREFPLLAAQPLSSELAAYHPHIGLAVYLRDGRVVLWDKRFHGGRILYCPVTQAPVSWIWIDHERQEIWLLQDQTEHLPRMLTRIPLNGSPTKKIPLELPASSSHVTSAFYPGGQLLCSLSAREIIVCSPENGQKIATLQLPDHGRLFGRYFQETTNRWRILSLQHSRLTSEIVPTKELPKSDILRCFDRDGHEGTHVVLTNGSIFRLKPEAALVHKMPLGITQVRGISRDGHRLLYVDDLGNTRLLDLNQGRFETIPPRAHHPLQLVEKDVALFHKRVPSLRKNFRSIAITGSGAFALITRNNQVVVMQHLASQGMIHLQHLPNRPDELKEIPFMPIESPFGEHHSLARADCADGSRFYLDSRGYLHIVPGDPSLPQAALVMKDGMLSGWFSDNAWFGDRYFVGDRTPIDSASTFDRLAHCFCNLQFP